MLCFFLLVFGVAMRLIVHEANFTPVIALVLFGGVFFERKYAILFPLFLMMASDVILGLHNLVFFTWGSLILVSFIGLWLREHKTWIHMVGAGISSAFLFYILTNFGVWLMGYYPMTLAGLVDCYVLAIPFFRAMVLGTLAYSFVLFGVYEIIAQRAKVAQHALFFK